MNRTILFLLFCSIFFAKAQRWEWVSSAPTFLPYETESFRDLFFSNKNNGWAVTSRANVYKTSDGGASWNFISQIDTSSFAKRWHWMLTMRDSLVGFAMLRLQKTIYRTTDGGKTWQRFELPLSDTNFTFIGAGLSEGRFVFVGRGIARGYILSLGYDDSSAHKVRELINTTPSFFSGTLNGKNIVVFIKNQGSFFHIFENDSLQPWFFSLPMGQNCSSISLADSSAFISMESTPSFGTKLSYGCFLRYDLKSNSFTTMLNDRYFGSSDANYLRTFFVRKDLGWFSFGKGNLFESNDGGNSIEATNDGLEITKFVADFNNNVWGVGKNLIKLSLNEITSAGETKFSHPNIRFHPQSRTLFFDAHEGSVSINLWDLTGRLLKSLNRQISGSESFKLDIAEIPKGVYIIEINGVSGRSVHKFLLD